MVIFHCYVSLPEGRFLPANVMFVLPNLDTVHPYVGTVGAVEVAEFRIAQNLAPAFTTMCAWDGVLGTGWMIILYYFEAPKTQKPTGEDWGLF